MIADLAWLENAWVGCCPTLITAATLADMRCVVQYYIAATPLFVYVCIQVLELESLPKVVTLISGCYIGMEFAGMFARLGCEVHVVARQELPLAPRFDKEVRCRIGSRFQSLAGCLEG
jgi:NADPH-dependent 2,4-dienoyl-CoA reductase/sulfur reductase-like enzyme